MSPRAAGLPLLFILALPLAADGPPPPPTPEPGFALEVPLGSEEAVWSWCLERWGHGGSALPGLGQGFCADDAEERVVDDFFDDTRFTLAGNGQAQLRHRRWVEGSPQQRKREQLWLGGPDPKEWPVRPLEWQGEPEENVPGLQLVSRGDRAELAAALKQLEVGDALDLVHVLQLHRRLRRIHITRHEQPWATLTIDHARARKLWWRASVVRLELEPDPACPAEERAALTLAAGTMEAEVLRRFPELQANRVSAYGQGLQALESRAIAFRTSAVLGLPLFLVLALPIATGALIARAARRQAGLPSRRWR